MFYNKRIKELEKKVEYLENLYRDLAIYRTRYGQYMPLHDMLRENFRRIKEFINESGWKYQSEVTETKPAKWIKIKGDKK